MSERPTRQQVEEALIFAESIDLDENRRAELQDTTYVAWLAAEVKALQAGAELAHSEFAAMQVYNELLKKRLATVEALPGKWRADVFGRDSAVDSPWELALGDCAEELERALRGET